MEKDRYEHLAAQIFKSALEVHKALGPGLLESVYGFSLLTEFELRGISYKNQVKVPLFYKGRNTTKEFIIDVLVEEEIIIELKSVEGLLPVHQAQVLSYMKLADKRMGFLVNFNVVLLKDGFKRIVNNY